MRHRSRDDHRHHCHGGPPHGRRPFNPVWRYFKGRLHRRLFIWFGVAIFVTTGLTSMALWSGPRWLALIGGAGILWLASGLVAYRLTRPLAALVDVTRDIGAGKLDSRLRLRSAWGGELQVLADAVNDMATRIEQQISDQRELLAAVSHELRTPLGHMRVLLEMAREEATDTARIDEIEREVLTIDALVGQLLASSRVDFGTIDRRPLDAVELAITALDREGLPPTLLRAPENDGADARRFQGDAALVLQALSNLLRNAREHGGGVVSLDLEADDEHVRFVVRDEGPGFAEADLERVFESFQQGRARRRERGSLGLGLSLVRRIATTHDGEAWARNTTRGAEVGFTVKRRGTAFDGQETASAT